MNVCVTAFGFTLIDLTLFQRETDGPDDIDEVPETPAVVTGAWSDTERAEPHPIGFTATIPDRYVFDEPAEERKKGRSTAVRAQKVPQTSDLVAEKRPNVTPRPRRR